VLERWNRFVWAAEAGIALGGQREVGDGVRQLGSCWHRVGWAVKARIALGGRGHVGEGAGRIGIRWATEAGTALGGRGEVGYELESWLILR